MTAQELKSKMVSILKIIDFLEENGSGREEVQPFEKKYDEASRLYWIELRKQHGAGSWKPL